MNESSATAGGRFTGLGRFLRVLEIMVLVALIYSVIAFIIGWAMGGPDIIDGIRLLSSADYPPVASVWLRGLIYVLLLLATLWLLDRFTPKPNAWLTRLAQRTGPLVAIILLVVITVCVSAVFILALLATGGSLFPADLAAVATGGILGGGLIQLLAATVRPNPHSALEQRMQQQQETRARQEAERLGIDPEEAAEATRHFWHQSGHLIGMFMEKLHGFVIAVTGGGIHGAALFVIGASFFVGLGFGVSGAAVCLFYVVPLLFALADTVTLYAGNALLRRAGPDWVRYFTVPVFYPLIFALGLVCKGVTIGAGAFALQSLGGPRIPLNLYTQAFTSAPFGYGLTTTILFALILVWPLLRYIKPIRRELAR